jgi:hypothetical protein
VSAIPASSMITKVDGPIAVAHSGRSPWSRDEVSLARVSVRILVCSQEQRPRWPTEPGRPYGRRLRSTPGLGRA